MTQVHKDHIDPQSVMRSIAQKRTRFEAKERLVRFMIDDMDAAMDLCRLTLVHSSDNNAKWIVTRVMDCPSIITREPIKERMVKLFAATIPFVRLNDYGAEYNRRRDWLDSEAESNR